MMARAAYLENGVVKGDDVEGATCSDEDFYQTCIASREEIPRRCVEAQDGAARNWKKKRLSSLVFGYAVSKQ